MRIASLLAMIVLTSFVGLPSATAQFLDDGKPKAAEGGIELGADQTQRLRVGIVVKAVGGPVNGIYATTPVPIDWPEQKVKVVDDEFDREVARVGYRMIDDSVKQMVIQIPRIANGETVSAIVTFEVTRSAIQAPSATEQFRIPVNLNKQLRTYLGPSPMIETRSGKIREAARELAAAGEGKTDWEKVELMYDWVRENVEYKKGPLKGALRGMLDGEGDCEEMTSLFIALCRLNDVPARTVWIPGHCYPEFYLEDAEGNGHWFPAQAAGSRAFGAMPEYRPILQKGDNFNVPEHRERMRYVSEFLKGKATRGGGSPEVKFIREVLPN
ncbi:MAG: transglutaminase-like domain-containing protein [Pirellulales bacterium]